MYQSIDDPSEDGLTGEPESGKRGLWLIGGIAVIGVFAAVYVYSPGTRSAPGETVLDPEMRQAYLKALGETNPALRRARLQDFMRVYPTDERAPVAQAQLDVIDLYDNQVWNTVTRLVYTDSIKKEVKLAALDDYSANWGGALLGGRSDEIDALRNEVSGMKDVAALPDRRLKEGPSPISPNIRADNLAGGPRILPLPPAQPVYVPPPIETVKETKQVIVMPKVRRNATPRYPRKAMRRKINAIVTLSLNIDAKGKVQMTEVVGVDAERYEKDFIRAAERAALRTRFKPKTIDGRPVAASGIQKRYRFEIRRDN